MSVKRTHVLSEWNYPHICWYRTLLMSIHFSNQIRSRQGLLVLSHEAIRSYRYLDEARGVRSSFPFVILASLNCPHLFSFIRCAKYPELPTEIQTRVMCVLKWYRICSLDNGTDCMRPYIMLIVSTSFYRSFRNSHMVDSWKKQEARYIKECMLLNICV